MREAVEVEEEGAAKVARGEDDLKAAEEEEEDGEAEDESMGGLMLLEKSEVEAQSQWISRWNEAWEKNDEKRWTDGEEKMKKRMEGRGSGATAPVRLEGGCTG